MLLKGVLVVAAALQLPLCAQARESYEPVDDPPWMIRVFYDTVDGGYTVMQRNTSFHWR